MEKKRAGIIKAITALTLTAVLIFICFACDGKPWRVFYGDIKKCAVYDLTDGKMLYANGADEPIAPASLTKLLTSVTALEYCDADRAFIVGTERELIHAHSSLSLIRQGHILTLYDLIAAMLMVSGNDAAYTVAVNVARSVGGEDLSDTEALAFFCGLMNEKASEIGMKSSHFTTPDGWDDENQYTTVTDLVKLSEFALTFDEIREITALHEKYTVFLSGENITWTNSNQLLDPDSQYYCENAAGMKTGTTDKAGKCLISLFMKDGKRILVVVADCRTESERYEGSLRLFRKYA